MKRPAMNLKRLTTAALFLFLFLSATLAVAVPLPGGTLDPTTIPKYVAPLVIPPPMPYTAGTGANPDLYEIAVRQFQQQILPLTDTLGSPLGATTVWSYGSTSPEGVFHFPAFTIEATWNKPVQVKWINDLKDPVTGDCLPHLLPVDQTLHWANPLGPRDSRGTDNNPYLGPVPIVTHLHGAETNQESDGYPEAWYLPNCNIPANIKFTEGTLYNAFKTSSAVGNLWQPGSAVFTYPNTQRATTLWYHDHALGMTRLNVYAGPAGFYLLRGGPGDQVTDLASGATGTLPGPAPGHNDPPGTKYYEIPIAIQDRSFNVDGSLFFPADRAFFEGVTPQQLNIPFIPGLSALGLPSDVSPIWNPETFGNAMVVNGKTWPVLQVEQRRYRFRFLNGTLARFLILTTDTDNNPLNGITPQVTFYQIGAEGGFLPAPIAQTQLLMANAERADVIVDFTNIPVGTNITLLNIGPDSPFGGGTPYFGCLTDPLAPAGCFEPADTATTGQVMQFQVAACTGTDTSTPPSQLGLPARTPLPHHTNTRYLSLNELSSATICVAGDPVSGIYNVPIVEVACTDPNAVVFGPTEARLGTLDPVTQAPTVLSFMDSITETPAIGSTEVWEIWNFTADAHPIHIHQVQFEVLGRAVQGNPAATSVAGSNLPLPWETGTKDTVVVYPGEIARVKAMFGSPGLTVWHCHIVDHEDNEMMRPYCIANADGSLPAACQIANRMPEKIGVFRDGQVYRDMNGNGSWDPATDALSLFGIIGDISIAGDWNGTGASKIGVFRNGQWYLDMNGNGMFDYPSPDVIQNFGISGDIPVTGDWTGTGTTKIGVFRNGEWYLDMNGNGIWEPGIDAIYTFGIPGDTPITGDWTGTGKTMIGIARNAGGSLEWYVDANGNGAWDPGTDAVYAFGISGDTPIAGDWTRTGKTMIGIARNAGGSLEWYMDTNGNGAWDPGTDAVYAFGITGDTPVTGKW
jgi:spore coat protein A, manganese oxidase